MGDRADVVRRTLRRFAAAERSPDRARDEIEGHFTMVETQLADEAPASPPAPRGQRAGGPHAPEGITTIGQSVVIEGEVKGGEDLVIDGKVDGTIELPQHVLTVGPTGRVKAQLSVKSVVVLGKVSGRIDGERAGTYRRDRLGRRCDRGSAVGCGGRCALAGPRGRVGLGPGSPIRRRPAPAHFGATMFVCERASFGRPDAAVPVPVRAPRLATSGGQAGRGGPRHRCCGAA